MRDYVENIFWQGCGTAKQDVFGLVVCFEVELGGWRFIRLRDASVVFGQKYQLHWVHFQLIEERKRFQVTNRVTDLELRIPPFFRN